MTRRKVIYEEMGGTLVTEAVTKEGHMSWTWMITLVIALAIGVNLGVIVMALIQSGAREDSSAKPRHGERL